VRPACSTHSARKACGSRIQPPTPRSVSWRSSSSESFDQTTRRLGATIGWVPNPYEAGSGSRIAGIPGLSDGEPWGAIWPAPALGGALRDRVGMKPSSGVLSNCPEEMTIMERRMLARTLGPAVVRSAALITLPPVGSAPGRARSSHRPDRTRSHRDGVTATDWMPPTAGSSTSAPGAGFFGSRLSSVVCRRSTCPSTTASTPVALCDSN
jgi:hypothetical protein